MRRLICLIGASVVAIAVAAPAQAAPVGLSVVIVAHTDFTTEVSEFESNLPGCESGTVANGGGGPHFTPRGGAFAGEKIFECAGGDAGFTVLLTARFGGAGSTGRWTVADAWGNLEGMKGSGSLVGIPTSETSLDDIFTGTIR